MILLKLLNSFKTIFAFIVLIAGALFGVYRAGKKSVETKENEEVVKSVIAKNEIIQENHALSDSELDAKLSKWEKKSPN